VPLRADRPATTPARPLRSRLAPPADPQLAQTERLLSDFAGFWETETSPAERHRLLTTLFEQVWQKDGQIVAVKPNHAFANYFTAVSQGRATRPKADASSEAYKSGSDGGRDLDCCLAD
jgi:hypothetical protein